MSELTEDKAALLRKPFPANVIGKLPKGGTQLDYVGHAATTDRLLQVDPAWNWEPFATDANGLPAVDSRGNLWIRLTVCGVTRIGVGDGKSHKELIGDAIRNAAMRFGVALDLWSKDELEQTSGTGADKLRATLAKGTPATPKAAPEPAEDGITPEQSKKLHTLATKLGFDREYRIAGLQHITGRKDLASSKELTKAEAKTAINALEDLLSQQGSNESEASA